MLKNISFDSCGFRFKEVNLPEEIVLSSPVILHVKSRLSKFVKFKDILVEKDLVEQNFGDWAGKKISDVWEELKNNKSQHNFSFICPEICPPNGDSYLDQCDRVANFIDNFDFDNKKSVVYITHSGTIKAILSHILNIAPDKSIGIEISHLSFTSIEVIDNKQNKNRGGRFRVLKVNQQF